MSPRHGLTIVDGPDRARGGMAEWLKAAVLKTVERKLRGFESYSLRRQQFVEWWPRGRRRRFAKPLYG